MDKFYVYRPLLDLIGFTEGTAKARGYNETLAYGKMLDGKVTKGKAPTADLVSMTLAQLDALQTRMLADPDNKALKSSAAGMYQIVRTTARSIRQALPERYPADRKFDAECQDEMACYLLGVRGIDKYLSGRLKENSLINELAKEWASLPTLSGKGYYDGQNAAVGVARVREVLSEVRRRHSEGQPKQRVEVPVSVDRPVVPKTVEKEVRQKTNWLAGIFGTIFGGGGFGAWLAGMDRDALILVGAITVVVVVGGLIGGEWIIRRVRSIKKEIEA